MGNRLGHGLVELEPDQSVYGVSARKTFVHIVSVLPNASGEVTRYADIERTVPFAGQHVNGRLFGRHGTLSVIPVQTGI